MSREVMHQALNALLQCPPIVGRDNSINKIAIESLRAELAKGDGWIKCADRMPDIGVTVLACTRGKKVCLAQAGIEQPWRIALVDFGEWDLEWSLAEDDQHQVTHWRPLPMPPI